MISKRFESLRTNRRAISRMVVILIVIIVVGSAVGVVVAAVLLGFWQPFGLVTGSGTLATEEKQFTDFTIVEVGWGFEAEIDQSGSYSINITADDNMFGHIEISKTGNSLMIGLKWGYSYQDVTLRAEITMPNLYELKFSGGTHGTIEGFTSSHDFAVDLSGGSSLSGDFTTSGDAQFALSGGSNLMGMNGAANDLRVSAFGGSNLNLADFLVHNATVNLSGGCNAKINLDGILAGNLSGGSHLRYIGEPTTIDVNISDGSTVSPL